MHKLFIGIDFSKKKVDVSVIMKGNPSWGMHREFSNDVTGHGVVPFQRTSGSSVKSRARTSGFANKKLNTLLTQAARSAAIHDPILREYYKRKREEGKHHNLVINNIRNKLIHRICALVRNQTFNHAA